jgi:hypothetical protein
MTWDCRLDTRDPSRRPEVTSGEVFLRRSRAVVWGLAGGLVLAARPLVAQLAPPPVVNPASYQSRSGQYVLVGSASRALGLTGSLRVVHLEGSPTGEAMRPRIDPG